MDEVTLTGPTRVAEIHAGQVTLSTVTPEQFGLRRCALADLQGGDALQNAAIVRAVLGGETGPKRDVVLLNAAFSLVAAGLDVMIVDGLERATHAIDSGAARAKLEQLVSLTQNQ